MTLAILRENPAGPGTDADDAREAARGDRAAFERLYRRHSARIHSLARRMLGPDDADEATQDAFVRAWTKLDGFRGEAAFGTWLYRLSLNVILARRADAAKARKRFVAEEEMGELVHAGGARPDLGVDVTRALDRLPDGAREVLVLHDIEGYKHEEIAVLLGINAGTSKSQLHRARMLMRTHLA